VGHTLSANFRRKGRRSPTTVVLRKLEWLSFVWYWNIRSVLFGFVTKHACHGQTDRQIDRRTELRHLIPRWHSCSCCKKPQERFGFNRFSNWVVICCFPISFWDKYLLFHKLNTSIYRHQTPPRYRNAARGGPSHGHRACAQQISWRSVRRFQRYARGQTDTQRDRQTNWSQYMLPYWGGVTRTCIFHSLLVITVFVTRGALLIQNWSPQSRPVATCNQLQTHWETRPVLIVATGFGFATRPRCVAERLQYTS